MLIKGVRLYGKNDLRLEEFKLPSIKESEILAKVYANSICMSTLKAVRLGKEHKRVPDNVAENPVLTGHEFSGEIMQVGSQWQSKFKAGQRFSLQPAINYKGSMDSPGYSYAYCGGNATHIIIPSEVMEMDCLLPFNGESYFKAALSEPFSCAIGACRSLYRTNKINHEHELGIKTGGRMAILGGCGPMGFAIIDYAISGERRPAKLVVTDVDEARLKRAKQIFLPKAKSNNIELIFIHPGQLHETKNDPGGSTDPVGFDDIIVMVTSAQLLDESVGHLAFNGCLNFFAGPPDQNFKAPLNYYDVHYLEKHIIGTTGGNATDMREALALIDQESINPATLITHIGGLDAVKDTILQLDRLPGGKKLIYPHLAMELTAISDIPAKKGKSQFWHDLCTLIEKHDLLWSKEAEDYLLKNGKKI